MYRPEKSDVQNIILFRNEKNRRLDRSRRQRFSQVMSYGIIGDGEGKALRTLYHKFLKMEYTQIIFLIQLVFFFLLFFVRKSPLTHKIRQNTFFKFTFIQKDYHIRLSPYGLSKKYFYNSPSISLSGNFTHPSCLCTTQQTKIKNQDVEIIVISSSDLS